MIKHLFTSTAPDDDNATNVQGKHWNQDHQIDDPAALTAALNVFDSTHKGLVPVGGDNTKILRGDGWINGATATAFLNVFSSSLKGLVPASGGGITNFLRADGAWAPTASGLFDTILSPALVSPPGVGDWNAGTLGNITLIFITADGSQPVHGLVGGSDGKIAVILNISNPSSSTPFFQHESVGASPANRFINMGGGANNGGGSAGCVVYYYHGASSRWRNIWST